MILKSYIQNSITWNKNYIYVSFICASCLWQHIPSFIWEVLFDFQCYFTSSKTKICEQKTVEDATDRDL